MRDVTKLIHGPPRLNMEDQENKAPDFSWPIPDDPVAQLQEAAARAGATLTPVAVNPLDQAWGEGRPPQPAAPVVPHADEYSGESHAAKRARIGKAVAKAGADVALLTAPSSIAWLFNVRGGDVIRSPLPIGQALLATDGTARLFLDPANVTNELPQWLGDAVRIEATGGKALEVICQRMELGPGDAQGRRRPVAIPDDVRAVLAPLA